MGATQSSDKVPSPASLVESAMRRCPALAVICGDCRNEAFFHILSRDWEEALDHDWSHPGELSVSSSIKVVLYDIERKHVTPLHVACALQPPAHFIENIFIRDGVKSLITFVVNRSLPKQKDTTGPPLDSFRKMVGQDDLEKSTGLSSTGYASVLGENYQQLANESADLFSEQTPRSLVRRQHPRSNKMNMLLPTSIAVLEIGETGFNQKSKHSALVDISSEEKTSLVSQTILHEDRSNPAFTAGYSITSITQDKTSHSSSKEGSGDASLAPPSITGSGTLSEEEKLVSQTILHEDRSRPATSSIASLSIRQGKSLHLLLNKGSSQGDASLAPPSMTGSGTLSGEEKQIDATDVSLSTSSQSFSTMQNPLQISSNGAVARLSSDKFLLYEDRSKANSSGSKSSKESSKDELISPPSRGMATSPDIAEGQVTEVKVQLSSEENDLEKRKKRNPPVLIRESSLSISNVVHQAPNVADGIDVAADLESDLWLPLHIACLFRAAPDTIKMLLQCCSWAAKMKNSMGMLPIHIVCSGMSSPPHFVERDKNASADDSDKKYDAVKTVKLLLRAHPESVHVSSSNKDGKTPLQYAMEHLESGKTKSAIIKLFKVHLTKLEPLRSHSLVEDEPHKFEIPSVNSFCVDIGSRRGIFAKLKSGASYHSDKVPRLVDYIDASDWKSTLKRIVKYPEEARVWTMIDKETKKDYKSKDTIHRLPIHRICALKPPLEVVEAIYAAYPESMTCREKYGSLPLHLACQYVAARDVICFMASIYRPAIRATDEFGLLPIHLAVTECAPIEAIHFLLKGFPEGANIRDNSGMAPLDYARESSNPRRLSMITAIEKCQARFSARPSY